MNTPITESRPADSIAGFLSALSLLASALGLVYRPVRVIPFAIIVALVATVMGGTHSGLARFAVFAGAVCFAVGLAIAVVTSNPIF